jgi:hypothetical protein
VGEGKLERMGELEHENLEKEIRKLPSHLHRINLRGRDTQVPHTHTYPPKRKKERKKESVCEGKGQRKSSKRKFIIYP